MTLRSSAVRSVRAARGATTVDADTAADLSERVPELVMEVMRRNDIANPDIVSILFTATPDISSMHPATAARHGVDLAGVPMTGAQELDVDGSVPLCVRLMMHFETDLTRDQVSHVYLHGAQVLRPDLVVEDQAR